MNRMLKLPLLIALSLGSTQLLAVDFGQVRVMSSLGQPLKAEIPVRGASPAELKNLTAQLASAAEYERAGITGGRTEVPLNFSVSSSGGQHFIRITSTVPVDDPYLDLLLDVNTAAGRSVHEFAILLDPAGMPGPAIAGGAERSAPRTPAAAGEAAPHAVASAAPSKAAPAARATTPASKPAGTVAKGMYGPVERGQTLSGIAQQTLPAGVDVNQMLLAIKQANPDAFYRDNINTLKSGVVLRVPTAAQAQEVTVAAAMAEVRRQNADWRGGSVGAPATVADTGTRSTASSAPTTTAAKAGDRLALLAAKDTGKTAAGSAGGRAGESAADLRKDLMRAQENLASQQQQVADLKSRLKELDDVNNKSGRLLSLKDSEIAGLQAQLAAARKAGFVAPAPSASSKAVLAESAALASARSAAATLAAGRAVNPASGSSTGKHAVASAASTATPAAAAAAAAASLKPKPTAKPNAKPAAPAAKPVAAQPWYMQTWAWIAGAGVVVLLFLLALMGRQRKRPQPAQARIAPSLADSFTASSAPGLSVDDVDQGELLDQLAEHPDDIGLHLQLVTLYYSRRDVEHFEAAAEAMYAHISDPQQDEWQDVVHMGEDLVPEHPLFAAHHDQPPASVPAASGPLQDFNIDDYADDDSLTLSEPVTMASTTMGYPGIKDARVDFNAGSPSGFQSVSEELDVAPEAPASVAEAPVAAAPVRAPEAAPHGGTGGGLGEFNDDPIDTKLDLARAYLDMGDEEGARAMLDEVLKEGSQMQKDVATSLLADMRS